MSLAIRAGRAARTATLIFSLVRELADYEKLSAEVGCDAARRSPPRCSRASRGVFCDIAEWDGEPAGFARLVSQLLDFPRPSRHLSRGYFRAAGVSRPRHRQGADGAAGATLRRGRLRRASSGRCSTGTRRRSRSTSRIGAQVMDDWKICRLSGEALGAACAVRGQRHDHRPGRRDRRKQCHRPTRASCRGGCKSDLQHFRALTIDKPVIMGRKTFESIGKPLDRRTNIVLTRDTEIRACGRHHRAEFQGGAGDRAEAMQRGSAPTKSW